MRHRNRILSLLFGAGILAAGSLWGQRVEVPRIIETSTTWTSDNEYVMNGYTFVVTPENATEPTVLTIEPGTVIFGQTTDQGVAGEPGALVITRGAQIDAQGTRNRPIIFTSILDDPIGSGGETLGLWGGVVLLGNAQISSRADNAIVPAPVEDQVEGFSVEGDEIDFITFGGTDDSDNSGTMRYVQIRHGGEVIGTANEINGLTMGGVGNQTTIEFIEVIFNKDDAFEWFGGTVNGRYLVAAFCGDDSFDYDQGWRGYGQFWFTIGKELDGDQMDKAGEHDGATAPLDAEPEGIGRVANATYIGMGPGQPNNIAVNIRDNAGAIYRNSIFTNFASMLLIEADNIDRMDDVEFTHSIFWSHLANDTDSLVAGTAANVLDATKALIEHPTNDVVNPQLISIGYEPNGMLDPRPAAGSPALYGAGAVLPPANNFQFVQTGYRGAFGSENWMKGWTALDQLGYLAPGGAPMEDNEFTGISTRGLIGASGPDAVLNSSVIIVGSEPMNVLFRARSTSINLEGVDLLPNPMIDVVRIGQGVIGENDSYLTAANLEMLSGTQYDPETVGMNEEEALLLFLDLEPGAYSVRVRSAVEGETGLAIAEAFVVR